VQTSVVMLLDEDTMMGNKNRRSKATGVRDSAEGQTEQDGNPIAGTTGHTWD
jgi:hypothetical protein